MAVEERECVARRGRRTGRPHLDSPGAPHTAAQGHGRLPRDHDAAGRGTAALGASDRRRARQGQAGGARRRARRGRRTARPGRRLRRRHAGGGPEDDQGPRRHPADHRPGPAAHRYRRVHRRKSRSSGPTCTTCPTSPRDHESSRRLQRNLVAVYTRIVQLVPYLPDELQMAAVNIDDPATLGYFIGLHHAHQDRGQAGPPRRGRRRQAAHATHRIA